jgi:hypothetical protein
MMSPVRVRPMLRRLRAAGSGTGVARKPGSPVLSKKSPTICPASLMLVAPAEVAPGTASSVY